MASVQEIIESLLDDKITKLLEQERNEAISQEREKWYQRAVVASLALALLGALLLVSDYRANYLMKQDAVKACENRNDKEQVLLPIFDAVIEANSVSRPGETAKEAARRVESVALFKDAKEEYGTPEDCANLFD